MKLLFWRTLNITKLCRFENIPRFIKIKKNNNYEIVIFNHYIHREMRLHF